MIRWLWHGPAVVLTAVLIAGVWAYRYVLRPLLPPTCRFDPG
jgi:putative component of membrane protein insertase Oxa1/YidC/SpoIIIJ protein YidD